MSSPTPLSSHSVQDSHTSTPSKSRHTPRTPTLNIKVQILIRPENLRSRPTVTQQILAHKRIQLTRLRTGKTTMVMSSHLTIPKRLQRSQRLIIFPRSTHASVRRNLAQPLEIGVFHDVETAGRNEGNEEVVVKGQLVDVVNVGVEGRREPDVFADDLLGVLHVVAVGILPGFKAPAASAAGAGFLGQGEGDARLERARHKGALAVAGTARYADAGRVDIGLRLGEFQGVDDAGDAPGPGGEGTGGVRRTMEVVELALAARGAICLGGDVVVVEEDGGDARGDGDASAVGAVADDGREGARPRRLVDGDGEGDGLAAGGGGDAEGTAGVAGGDSGLGGEGAELVFFENSLDFGLTAGPIVAVGDLLASGESEGVRKG